MLDKPKQLEVCSNRAWVSQFLDWDGDSIDIYDDVDHFWQVLIYNLEDHDFEVVLAPGERSTFHGWNGAKFKHRISVVGSFDDLSPTEEGIILEVISFAFDRVMVGGQE
jgi:hypothetical protein